jgi:hypothetical protein
MIRLGALLILTVLGLASPALACSTSGSSTFCADGWVAQRVEPRRPDSSDIGADAGYGDGTGLDPGSTADGVYVEGAVVVEEPPLEIEGQL